MFDKLKQFSERIELSRKLAASVLKGLQPFVLWDGYDRKVACSLD